MTPVAALVFATTAAHATGVPAHDTLVVRDAACTPVVLADPSLLITYDSISGTCAPPRPEGNSCSWQIEASLSPRDLVVKQQGCDEPLPGRFTRSGACEGAPLWRWTGDMVPGERHTIGLDSPYAAAVAQAPGVAAPVQICPPESPKVHPIRTADVVSPASPPQWIAFPADGFSVGVEADAARVIWTPGPRLRHWVLYNDDAVLMSDLLPPADAQAALDGALHEPTGLAVRHQVVEWREHFEGYRKRRVDYCTRVLEQDVEVGLRAALPDTPETVLRGTLQHREATTAEHCKRR